nr:GyrI-like domain-containing protein [uncultured Mucilaginibacter sp.]
MQPRFLTISSKIIAGQRLNMSFSQNKTGLLWQRFMPRRAEIKNPVNSLFYSLEVYPSAFFDDFKPTNEFEKWAGVEISDSSEQAPGIELLTIPSGEYAVFTHRGPASAGPKTYQYIYGVWFPASDYIIDNRPHFALMDEKYKHDEPDSEEDIYIPVKPR